MPRITWAIWLAMRRGRTRPCSEYWRSEDRRHRWELRLHSRVELQALWLQVRGSETGRARASLVRVDEGARLARGEACARVAAVSNRPPPARRAHVRSRGDPRARRADAQHALPHGGSSRRLSCREMAEIAGAKAGDVLCFGHTHMPWHRIVEGIHFVNTGSVGRPEGRQTGAPAT